MPYMQATTSVDTDDDEQYKKELFKHPPQHDLRAN